MTIRPFNEYVAKKLQEPAFAAAYLEVALEDDGVEEFLNSLRKVLQANGGVSKFAEAAGMSDEAARQTLSPTEATEFGSVVRLLNAAGIDLKFKARRKVVRKAKPRPTTKETEIIGAE